VNTGIKIGLAAVLLAWLTTGLAPAQEYALVRAKAAEVIRANDLDASRLAAVAEAKRCCLKDVLSVELLGPANYQKHAQVLQTVFLEKPDPYLARFDIENEEIIDDGQRYQVTVAAKVRKSSVNAALAEKGIRDASEGALQPTVMVLVRERFETRVSGTRTAETLLINDLQAAGFKVVDPEQKKLIDLRNKLYAEATGNLQGALQTALSFNADYLIFGEVVVTSGGPLAGTDLKVRSANMSLRAVEASSGKIMVATRSEGKKRHVDELTGGNWAIEEAAAVASKEIAAKLKAILKQEQSTKGVEVVIDAYGLDFDSQAQDMAAALKKIENVSSVNCRFFYSGVAQFEVLYKGNTDGLAAALRQSEIDGQAVEIIEALPRYLRVQRQGSKRVAQESVEGVFNRYLQEKHKFFDAEAAREKDTELANKIKALAESKRINDDQKKQLYAAQKDLEKKREEAYYREKELQKRMEQARQAEEVCRRLDDKYQMLSRQLDSSEADKRQLQHDLEEARHARYTAAANARNASSSASSSGMEYVQMTQSVMGMIQGFGGF